MAGAVPGTVSVEDAGVVLRAVVTLPGCPVARALSAFTDPALLTRWWGGELAAELTAGGHYVVRFASLGRAMTGRVISYEPPRSLEFTWSWDQQDEPGRTVAVTTGGSGTTTLTVIHGKYGENASERAARAEHRAGWEHFLPRLAAAVLCPG
jgi:uncharacterized protein YndB with AHSA1/START domain